MFTGPQVVAQAVLRRTHKAVNACIKEDGEQSNTQQETEKRAELRKKTRVKKRVK